MTIPRGRNLLNQLDRKMYGITSSIIEHETGKTRTFVIAGIPPVKAVEELASIIDSLPGDWRVASISTPNSIHADVTGHRMNRGANPEQVLMSKIGRLDLLHVPLKFKSRAGQRDK